MVSLDNKTGELEAPLSCAGQGQACGGLPTEGTRPGYVARRLGVMGIRYEAPRQRRQSLAHQMEGALSTVPC